MGTTVRALPGCAATSRRSDKIGRVSVSLVATIHRRHRRGYLFTLFTARRIRAIVLSVMSAISEGPTAGHGPRCPAKGTSRVRGVKSISRGWRASRGLVARCPPENSTTDRGRQEERRRTGRIAESIGTRPIAPPVIPDHDRETIVVHYARQNHLSQK